MNRLIRFAAVASLLVLLAGCASTPQTGGASASNRSSPADSGQRAPEASDRDGSTESAAVRHLLARAEQASREGDNDRAAGQLERALRIEPRNPALWHNLAIVRYRQNDYAQAERLALRSESFNDNDARLRLRNWRLIAAARQESGDEQGARAAHDKVQQLESGEPDR